MYTVPFSMLTKESASKDLVCAEEAWGGGWNWGVLMVVQVPLLVGRPLFGLLEFRCLFLRSLPSIGTILFNVLGRVSRVS